MSEETTGVETPTTEPTSPEATETAAAPDTSHIDRLTERMDQFAQDQARWMEEFRASQYEPEPEDDPYPLDEDDDGYDEQEARRVLDDMVNERVQQALTPIQQQQNLRERDSLLGKLEEKYPDLTDEKVSGPVLNAAAQFVQEIGKPELIDTPQFATLVETMYKASVSDQRAQQETPAGAKQQVTLEGGGGAAPQEPDKDLQDRLIARHKATAGDW